MLYRGCSTAGNCGIWSRKLRVVQLVNKAHLHLINLSLCVWVLQQLLTKEPVVCTMQRDTVAPTKQRKVVIIPHRQAVRVISGLIEKPWICSRWFILWPLFVVEPFLFQPPFWVPGSPTPDYLLTEKKKQPRVICRLLFNQPTVGKLKSPSCYCGLITFGGTGNLVLELLGRFTGISLFVLTMCLCLSPSVSFHFQVLNQDLGLLAFSLVNYLTLQCPWLNTFDLLFIDFVFIQWPLKYLSA